MPQRKSFSANAGTNGDSAEVGTTREKGPATISARHSAESGTEVSAKGSADNGTPQDTKNNKYQDTLVLCNRDKA